MEEKTIKLRAELVEQLEKLASVQGRSVDEVLADLIESRSAPRAGSGWALRVAERMENLDIEWHDEPELSSRSRETYQNDLYERWQRSQLADNEHE
jgi:hypothetical protein